MQATGLAQVTWSAHALDLGMPLDRRKPPCGGAGHRLGTGRTAGAGHGVGALESGQAMEAGQDTEHVQAMASGQAMQSVQAMASGQGGGTWHPCKQ